MLSVALFTSLLAAADAPTGAAALAAAERAFAADGARIGIKQSFLIHLDKKSWVFNPDPASGYEVYSKRPEKSDILEWGPEVTAIAASGDFGLSSGPWRYRATADGKPAFGHFVSIWKRDADGAWHVHVDHGVSHDEVPVPAASLREIALPSAGRAAALGKSALKDRREALLHADDALRAALREKPSRNVIEEYADPNFIALREGHTPATGDASMQLVAQDPPGFGSGKRKAFDMASSGDLAYTIGGDRAEPDRAADYRVWTYRDGAWRILVDDVTPLH